MFALAFVLLTSSWQVWDQLNNKLTVYSGPTDKSEICYQGGAEYYNGKCVQDGKPTTQYEIRVRNEEEAKNKK